MSEARKLFKIGERVKLSNLGIKCLEHIKTGIYPKYDSALRGTVKGFDEHGGVTVQRDGIRKFDDYSPLFWEAA